MSKSVASSVERPSSGARIEVLPESDRSPVNLKQRIQLNIQLQWLWRLELPLSTKTGLAQTCVKQQ